MWLAPAASAQPGSNIAQAWDSVIKDAIPQAPVDPVLKQDQSPFRKGRAADFANHLVFEIRSDYEHSDLNFTGLPTLSRIINEPFTGTFNPSLGFPYQPAFQPDANRIYTFLNFGTRGWGSDRVNSNFAFRYRQDLTAVDISSPNANVLETYGGRRLIELIDGSIEINSRPTDGAWSGTSLSLGRQTIYGAESASLDGASFSLNKRVVSLTLFGGRRFTYFSDPLQRAIGGGSILFRLDPSTSVSYETLFYIRGTHRVTVRRRFHDSWVAAGSFKAYGGSPTDFHVQLFYQPRNGRTTARLSFFQKLNDKDYFYDFTVAAIDQDPKNRYLRLNLGPLQPYSLFTVDARHSFATRFNLSGIFAIQRLNENNMDQGPFLTSFRDYRVNAQVVPLRRVAMDFGYHQHDSDRLPPLSGQLLFDQISHSGETSVKDLTGQIRRTFGEGRLTLSGGAYYRRIDQQDRSVIITGAHQSGWLAGAWWKVDQHTRVLFDYSLDNDFFVFRPALSNSRILRVGLNWKY